MSASINKTSAAATLVVLDAYMRLYITRMQNYFSAPVIHMNVFICTANEERMYTPPIEGPRRRKKQGKERSKPCARITLSSLKGPLCSSLASLK